MTHKNKLTIPIPPPPPFSLFLSRTLSLRACPCVFQPSKKSMSIDKQILDAAPDAHMFDVFHVMPDGKVMVMTELDMLLSLDEYKKLRGKTLPSGAPADLEDDDSGSESGVRSSKRRAWRNSRYRNRDRLRRQKRKADSDRSLLWPGCRVYFEVDGSFSDEDRATLDLAMAEWEKYTCLSFHESNTRSSRLQFKNGAGCYSQLGRQTTPQIVALAPTCRTKGIIAHEIGHAIGWYHEHMRPDRDSYISINFNNIPTRYHINFQMYPSEQIETHGVEYDYTSLMHYGNNALPNSIVALDPTYQDKMGQREGLSFKDIKLANIMYNCAEVMHCPVKRDCEYGGFQFYKSHKNEDRCECWCDSGDVSDPLILCSELDAPPPRPVIRPTETPVVDLCYDVRTDCQEMKEKGHCMSKLAFMMDICKETCGFCGSGGEGGPEPCMDHDKGCAMMAATGTCKTLEPVMSKQCPASCDLCPAPPDPCQIQKEVVAMFYDIPNRSSRATGVSYLTMVVSLVAVTLRLSRR